VKISVRTVHRILHSAGRKAYRPIKVPMMSTANRKKRLLWARAHSGVTVDDWKKVRKMHSTIHKMFATLSPFVSQVIFSDETTLIVGPARRAYVRRGDGERISSRHLQPRCACPLKLMVWTCFSWFGTGVLEVVEGSINSQRYINIIDNALVPSADLCYKNNEWHNTAGHGKHRNSMFRMASQLAGSQPNRKLLEHPEETRLRLCYSQQG
jgi:hypothetical protein